MTNKSDFDLEINAWTDKFNNSSDQRNAAQVLSVHFAQFLSDNNKTFGQQRKEGGD